VTKNDTYADNWVIHPTSVKSPNKGKIGYLGVAFYYQLSGMARIKIVELHQTVVNLHVLNSLCKSTVTFTFRAPADYTCIDKRTLLSYAWAEFIRG